jgi:hypothetical protein
VPLEPLVPDDPLLLLPGVLLLDPGEDELLLPGVVELLPLEDVPGLPMLLLGRVPRPEEPELMPDWEPLMPGEPTALELDDPSEPL